MDKGSIGNSMFNKADFTERERRTNSNSPEMLEGDDIVSHPSERSDSPLFPIGSRSHSSQSPEKVVEQPAYEFSYFSRRSFSYAQGEGRELPSQMQLPANISIEFSLHDRN